MSREAIVIPPGYERLCPVGYNRTDKDNRRWLDAQVPFSCDTNDPEYGVFLETCKSDSKKLEQALVVELDARKTPVWIRRRSRPQYARDYLRVAFMIRPPFFSSELPVEDKVKTRMQDDQNRNTFVMHFDQKHHLQIVRFWKLKDDKEKTLSRAEINNRLVQETPFFEENYGNWEKFAEKIADILEIYLEENK